MPEKIEATEEEVDITVGSELVEVWVQRYKVRTLLTTNFQLSRGRDQGDGENSTCLRLG